jgi:hypothetical protein
LYDDGDGIKHSFTDKLPITNFPLKTGDSKDAPVVIYEFPMEDPPYGLYTAGVDPYRQGKSAYSSSLGAVYIYKRCILLQEKLIICLLHVEPDQRKKPGKSKLDLLVKDTEHFVKR